MNLLELRDLCITYQGEKEAVHHVSFSVPEKSIVAIVGESGSGKSTVIRGIMGLLSAGGKITGGEILFQGKDLTKLSKEELRQIRGKDIAMIFQDAGAYLDSKKKIGSQYLEAMRAHQKMSKAEGLETARKMLGQLNLADPDRILRSYAFQLSGGMRQRVAIAMAMTSKPALLLADEPTSALDVTVQAQVVQQMIEQRDRTGTAVMIVTHNMGVASRMADYIAVMKQGQLMEFGTRDQVIDHPQSEYTRKLLSVVPELEEDTHGE